MNILVFDTCLDKMYVAIAQDDKVLSSKIVTNQDNKYHSAFLISTIKGMLKENNLTPKDINAIGTNVGPGSFTGIKHAQQLQELWLNNLICRQQEFHL